MNTKRILGLGFLVALSACKGQCSCGTDSDDGDTGAGGAGGGVTVSVGNGSTSTGDGGAGTGGDATGTGGQGGNPAIIRPQVRFVNVATNVEDLNFCLIDDGGAFIGPLESSITAPGVSDYSEVGVGNYQLVAIAPDGACDDDDAVVFDPLPLADGGVYSLALVGDAEALEVEQYSDDLALPAAGMVKLRFVHAAEGAPNVDIGVYEGEQFIPFFQDASFPNDSGYTEVAAFADADLVARAAGTETDLITITGVNGQEGDIVNAYAIGNPTDGVDVFFFSDGPVD